MRLRALLVLAAVASCLAACGDSDSGSSSSTSNPSVSAAEQRQAQAEADARVEAHNEDVEREYEERQEAEAPTEDEQEAAQVTTDFYAILGEDRAKRNPNTTTVDSGTFCELMSVEAQLQTIEYAKVSSGVQKDWDCESAVDLLILRSKRSGGFKNLKNPRIVGINADGDVATASVRFGNGPVTSIRLVKEGGDWKLAAAPTDSAE